MIERNRCVKNLVTVVDPYSEKFTGEINVNPRVTTFLNFSTFHDEIVEDLDRSSLGYRHDTGVEYEKRVRVPTHVKRYGDNERCRKSVRFLSTVYTRSRLNFTDHTGYIRGTSSTVNLLSIPNRTV